MLPLCRQWEVASFGAPGGIWGWRCALSVVAHDGFVQSERIAVRWETAVRA